MRGIRVAGAYVACTLVVGMLCCRAPALVAESETNEPFECPHMTPPLVAVINAFPRVYRVGGFGGPGGSGYFDFYYRGNTDRLNDFLRSLAHVRARSLTVVLMPGPGMKRGMGPHPPPGEQDTRRVYLYNWALCAFYPWVPSEERPDPCRWDVMVCVHVCDPIAIERLELPLAFEASVGGRLGDFVAMHNQRRLRAAEQAPGDRDTRPTVEATRGADLFGPP